MKGMTSQLPKSHVSPDPSPERINTMASLDPKHATIKFAEGV